MSSFSRILCVVDPTRDVQPAVSRATWLAKSTGASIELLVCYYNEYLGGGYIFDATSLIKTREQVLAGYKDKLETLAEPLRSSGLAVTTNAVWDHPLYEGIIRQASLYRADVVLKDTHHHSALARALLTNSDWDLIRTCPVPVWLVKPGDVSEAPVFLAALDPLNENDKPAALDDQIMVLSKSLATDVSGEVHAFHAYDPVLAIPMATPHAYVPISPPLQELEDQMRKRHKRKFDEVLTFHEIDDKHAHLVSGLTHEELPALATNLDASVVVMGAISRNKLKRLFVGATAERTLEHLPCDLLIVKPEWFHSPVDLQVSDAA